MLSSRPDAACAAMAIGTTRDLEQRGARSTSSYMLALTDTSRPGCSCSVVYGLSCCLLLEDSRHEIIFVPLPPKYSCISFFYFIATASGDHFGHR
jgi:hypothetical protein